MRQVELKVKAYLDQESQWQRKSQSLPHNRMFVVAAIALLIMSAVYNGQLGSGSNQLGAGPVYTAVVHGVDVRAQRVLVLVDDSGSMDNKGNEVRSQLGRLESAGISIANEVKVFGFAISFNKNYTLLKKLDDALTTDSSIDTVYVITDFSGTDYRANQPEAYEEIRQILRSHSVRLYWATVNEEPIQEYYEIARQSGGDVIPKI